MRKIKNKMVNSHSTIDPMQDEEFKEIWIDHICAKIHHMYEKVSKKYKITALSRAIKQQEK